MAKVVHIKLAENDDLSPCLEQFIATTRAEWVLYAHHGHRPGSAISKKVVLYQLNKKLLLP